MLCYYDSDNFSFFTIISRRAFIKMKNLYFISFLHSFIKLLQLKIKTPFFASLNNFLKNILEPYNT